jgi:hypothetical protein
VDYNKPQTIKRGDTTFITTHFRASEWYSTSSDAPAEHPIYPPLLAAAEFLRVYFNTPWRITSSYRTEAHERQILKSLGKKFFVDQHMKGRAFDSRPADGGALGKKIKEELYADFIAQGPIYQQLRELGITGFGIYDWGIHLDCRVDSFTAKRKDKWGLVACWDERTNAKKKFGGVAFNQAPTKAPMTPKPTSPKLPLPQASPKLAVQVRPGASAGSSSR